LRRKNDIEVKLTSNGLVVRAGKVMEYLQQQGMSAEKARHVRAPSGLNILGEVSGGDCGKRAGGNYPNESERGQDGGSTQSERGASDQSSCHSFARHSRRSERCDFAEWW
jgi:hypothetical protein